MKDISQLNSELERYFYLIPIIINKFDLPSQIDMAGLIGEMSDRLCTCIQSYRIWYDTKFETYASQALTGAVLSHLRTNNPISRRQNEFLKSVDKATDLLKSNLGRNPSKIELANYLDLTPEELSKKTTIVNLIPLSELSDDESVPAQFIDDDKNPSTALTTADLIRYFNSNILSNLNPMEKLVIQLLYNENKSLSEAGEKIGVSKQRVHQLHRELLIKLKAEIKKYPELACN